MNKGKCRRQKVKKVQLKNSKKRIFMWHDVDKKSNRKACI